MWKSREPYYGGVIEHMESSGRAKSKNGVLAPRYIVESSKHLIHYGIACVFAAQVCTLVRGEDDTWTNCLRHSALRWLI